MTAAVLNVLVGLVTSVLSGGSVWLWEKGRRSRLTRRKAAFFGLGHNSQCLIVMNEKHSAPGTVAQHDVYAMIEVAVLARELGSPLTIMKSDFQGRNGDRVEFCIGGPSGGSNPRSGGHLTAHLPGVRIHPYSLDKESLSIVVGERNFPCDRGNREHVLIAKFTPSGSTRPVILLCGQTSIGNRAGIAFLKHEYRALSKTLHSTSRFCIVVEVAAIQTYGHEATNLAADVTAIAFAPSINPPPHADPVEQPLAD